ncbi:MAG: nitroreductase family protein [Candidatus Thermoplasmatota archaeon]|nr:nitroreductase family protein [Candidatus Thermoplasmatota archaeon]
MDVYDAIRARRSERDYDSKPVPEDVLNRVLEAGRISPSASNYQPWHFIVVRDPERRKALTDGRYAKFLTQSPVVIVGLGDTKTSPEWHVVDTTIALQHMVIAATAEGLGTCWIGSFYEDRVKAALGVPERYRVVAMLAMGYPKEKTDIRSAIARPKNRKELKRILSFDKFAPPRPTVRAPSGRLRRKQ